MKRIIILISALVLISVGLFAQKNKQQIDKVIVYQDDNFKISVYVNSIVKENEYVTYWSEWEYLTQKSRNGVINDRINFIKKYEENIIIDFVEWSKFKSIIYKDCIDITDKTNNSISSTYYTINGTVLYSYKRETVSWTDIIPGSVGETIYNYINKLSKHIQ